MGTGSSSLEFPLNIVAGQTIQITYNDTARLEQAVAAYHEALVEYLVLFYQSRWCG